MEATMRVLITDDSKMSIISVKHVFDGMEDVEIISAYNGVEALEQHRTFRPDVIFLEITMPVLDGLATLKIIRLLDRKVKIIIISSIANQKTVQQDCKKYDVLAILPKPLKKQEILELLGLGDAK